MANPDELREAIQPHAVYDPDSGVARVVRIGDKLRSTHPAVLSNPHFFTSLDLPTDERPHWRDQIQARG